MAVSGRRKALDAMGHLDSPVPASITLAGTNFFADGHPVLTQVPSNIIATPSQISYPDKTKNNTASEGCFVGFDVEEPNSRHVVPLGKLSGIRFTSIFRFKLWWSTHWAGSRGREVEYETQMMILDKSDLGRPYVILLPIIEGSFSGSLQPGADDNVDICVESGSTKVCGSSFRSCLYMHIGEDPYNLVKEAMKVARVHLGTFRLLHEKSPPGMVDKFGWCSWDAFRRFVSPQGVWDAVKALHEAGCPPGVVLIDDGWQSVSLDDDPIEKEGIDRAAAGEEKGYRLVKFQENYRFKDYESRSTKTPNKGLGAFVKDLKEEFKTVEYVYVWQALCGFWGGIRPNVPGMPESRMVQAKFSPSLLQTMKDFAVSNTARDGVGLVLPEQADKLFEGLHSHLESERIDGVKIDVIEVLELLSEDFGGRVELGKAYYNALTASLKKHFNGNGVISSMQQASDFFFLGTEAIALGRVGDDFWCTDPYGDPTGTFWLQGCHMVHCAYNSLWMGNFIHPDWDMFQSHHQCAEFHAASRAISGGPIYVSDSVGKHNFDLLRKLGLPDGAILRCQHYALPTRDCLFEDPLHDGKTALKIWNLNKYSGVLGLFNCQGGGWCPASRRNKSAPECATLVDCFASPRDIEWNSGKTPISVQGVSIYAVYKYQSKTMKLVKPSEKIEVALEPLSYELFTVSPVAILPKKQIQFAAIGLVNMLNSGGAIQSLALDGNENMVRIGVRGSGELTMFASEKPRACRIDGTPVEFGYDEQTVRLEVPWINSPMPLIVEYFF